MADLNIKIPLSEKLRFLSGGGEMGALIRAKDWSKHNIGPFDQWPQSLRTTLSIILNSKFPMFLFWGPELICFYNDAYRPSLGKNGKHPNILGIPGKDAWPEIWHIIKPLIDQVLSGGEATWSEDQLIPIYRNGKIEDVYWTFSYSPVSDESRNVAGVFVTCTETTEKVAILNRIKNSEKRFRDIVKQAPLGITIFRGRELIVEMANETYLQIVDKKEDEFVGKPLFESLPEVKDAVGSLLDSVIETGIPQYGTEFPITLNRYGKAELTYFNFVYHPLRDEDGKISGIIVVASDVTESVNGKHSLAESEKQFRNLVMQSPIPMSIFRGKDYIIELANKEMLENIWRKKPEEVIGRSVLEVFPELKKQKYPELLHRVFTTGEIYWENESVAYVQGNDGLQKFYLDFEYNPLFESDGTISRIMVTVSDVTEKVEARQKVENAEERLRLAVEATEIATWDLDINTHEIIYSPRLTEIFGHDTSKVLTHHEMRGQIHEDDLHNIVEKAFDIALQTGIYWYETRVITPAADIRWIRTQGKIFYDEKNKPLKIIGTLRDITKGKQKQQELEDSEQKFRLLAESMPQFIWTGDAEGNLNYFNQAVYDYSGLTPQQINEDGWLQIIHPDDRPENIVAWTNSVTTGKDFLFEHRFRRHDGEYRWQLSRAVPQREASGKIQMWVGTSTDIQEIKEMDQQKDYFISLASHELKTPITSIKAYIQILQTQYADSNDSFLVKSLNIVDKQILKLTSLITDLLDLSKIKTGTLTLHKESFNVKELAFEVIEELKHVNPDYDISLSINENIDIHADRERIGQVLINLLTNAIKYSPNTVNIKVAGSVKNNNLYITVEDFGIGINKANQEKIFERFYRVEGKSEKTFPGFGIGLFIAMEIIQRHSGQIGVTSEPGKGSIFYFSIPLS